MLIKSKPSAHDCERGIEGAAKNTRSVSGTKRSFLEAFNSLVNQINHKNVCLITCGIKKSRWNTSMPPSLSGKKRWKGRQSVLGKKHGHRAKVTIFNKANDFKEVWKCFFIQTGIKITRFRKIATAEYLDNIKKVADIT